MSDTINICFRRLVSTKNIFKLTLGSVALWSLPLWENLSPRGKTFRTVYARTDIYRK